jgi:DNA-binding GntR family transcriptional regulator
MVQHGRSRPPSVQVADLLRARIESGEFAPGDPLPSIVTLGTEYGVTTNTIQKALKILKAEGLIVSTPGYGTFVAED